MNEVFQIRKRSSGRLGTSVGLSLTPSKRAVFFPRLYLLWVGRSSFSDLRLAVTRMVLCPNQHQFTPRLTTTEFSPFVPFSVSPAEEKRSRKKLSLDIVLEYISFIFIQKGALFQELPAPCNYASLHSYLRSEKYTISCEKTKRPSLPPAYVLSYMLPESFMILFPSYMTTLMCPVLGLWIRCHL